MSLKEKNKILLIFIELAIVGIAITFAYFVTSNTTKGEVESSVNVTTAVIRDIVLKIEGVVEVDDGTILPGHKLVSVIKVTATGNDEVLPYNLLWEGTSTFNTPFKFAVYKTEEKIEAKAVCEEKSTYLGEVTSFYEECEINNKEELGEIIGTGEITKEENIVELVNKETIVAPATGKTVYYYIVLEYPNKEEAQDNDRNKELSGKIKIEDIANDIEKPIITKVETVQTENEIEVRVEASDENRIREYGYQLNDEAIIRKTRNTHTFTGLTAGTSYSVKVYAEDAAGNKSKPTTEDITTTPTGITMDNIIASLNAKEETPDFSKTAIIDEGVYAVEDGMYGGTSYYWRGAATTNHVIFANKCWRIVRINGDGSMRLIYNGTIQSGNTCTGNGTNDANSIAVTSQKYNPTYNASYYVGWTYSTGSQRPSNLITSAASNAKTQTEKWYDSNIGNNTAYESKIDTNGKFCNDRNTGEPPSGWGSGFVTTWSATGTKFAYAGADRLYNKYQPTLSCPTGDVYSLKVGAITADEVELAGGNNANNTSYYLYTGQHYWTMSPYIWNDGCASMFFVNLYGSLNNHWVSTSFGLRPVINLKANTLFKAGTNGTLNNPYVVAN